MTESVPPLDPELRILLRANPPAPPDARQRVRSRLASSAPGFVPMGGAPAAAAGGALGALPTGALVFGAFVLGGLAGAVLFARLAREPQARVVYVDRPVPEVVASPPEAPSPAAHPEASSVATRPEAAPEPTKAALFEARSSEPPPPEAALHVVQATRPPRASQLAAERTLLDEARAALVQEAPERAIGLLNQHARRFPTAILGEERDAMQVEALVDAGRSSEARARADAFRVQRPNSLFLGTVESAIASIPQTP